MKSELKHSLAGLPTPRNDYEIVLPENEQSDHHGDGHQGDYVEDQADLDAKRLREIEQESKFLFAI